MTSVLKHSRFKVFFSALHIVYLVIIQLNQLCRFVSSCSCLYPPDVTFSEQQRLTQGATWTFFLPQQNWIAGRRQKTKTVSLSVHYKCNILRYRQCLGKEQNQYAPECPSVISIAYRKEEQGGVKESKENQRKEKERPQTWRMNANQSQSAISMSCYFEPELQVLTYNWAFTRTKRRRGTVKKRWEETTLWL